MKKEAGKVKIATFVVTAVAAAVVVGLLVYFVVPKGVSEEDYAALQARVEELSQEEGGETVDAAMLRYDLSKDTAFPSLKKIDQR